MLISCLRFSRLCICIIVLCSHSACKDKSDNENHLILEVYSYMERQKAESMNSLSALSHELQEKAASVTWSEKARVADSTFRKIQELVLNECNHIYKMRKEVLGISGIDSIAGNTFSPSNRIKKLGAYINRRQTENMVRMTQLQQTILESSSSLRENLGTSGIFSVYNDSLLMKNADTGFSLVDAWIILSLWESRFNDLLLQLGRYLKNTIPSSYEDSFEIYSLIIGQNYSRLAPGETLVISGGVGAFSSNNDTEFLVEDSLISKNIQGYFEYERTVPNKPGKYKLPVTLRFTSAWGKRETVTRMISFEVKR